jgi:SAM-dependent methyltransferase
MTCRACGSAHLRPLWRDGDGIAWSRCGTCGSDTSSAAYDLSRYDAGYVAHLLHGEGPDPDANHLHNADLFDAHLPGRPGRTFLDVGCGAGTSLAVMRARGWAGCGFDVTDAGRPSGVVVAPAFRADLFARPFDAVLAREIFEHVPDPRGLLRELRAATAAGGACQVTTPRPVGGPEWRCYHWAHLCVWHPDPLAAAAREAGFEVLEHVLWEFGQRLVCSPG